MSRLDSPTSGFGFTTSTNLFEENDRILAHIPKLKNIEKKLPLIGRDKYVIFYSWCALWTHTVCQGI